jgi:hypothetical protein
LQKHSFTKQQHNYNESQLARTEVEGTTRFVKHQYKSNMSKNKHDTKSLPAAKASKLFTLDKTKQCMGCGFARQKNRHECKARDEKCAACQAVGHYARCCTKTGRAVDSSQKQKVTKQEKYVRTVTEDRHEEALYNTLSDVISEVKIRLNRTMTQMIIWMVPLT